MYFLHIMKNIIYVQNLFYFSFSFIFKDNINATNSFFLEKLILHFLFFLFI